MLDDLTFLSHRSCYYNYITLNKQKIKQLDKIFYVLLFTSNDFHIYVSKPSIILFFILKKYISTVTLLINDGTWDGGRWVIKIHSKNSSWTPRDKDDKRRQNLPIAYEGGREGGGWCDTALLSVQSVSSSHLQGSCISDQYFQKYFSNFAPARHFISSDNNGR